MVGRWLASTVPGRIGMRDVVSGWVRTDWLQAGAHCEPTNIGGLAGVL